MLPQDDGPETNFNTTKIISVNTNVILKFTPMRAAMDLAFHKAGEMQDFSFTNEEHVCLVKSLLIPTPWGIL